MSTLARLALLSVWLTLPATGAPLDSDHDGIPDTLDKCMCDPRNATSSCDTDQDGYGNVCDGDFNQNGSVNSQDFSMFFAPSMRMGLPTTHGTDMNCNGTPNAQDFSMYFVPQLKLGIPGPSGLSCAGQPGCR